MYLSLAGAVTPFPAKVEVASTLPTCFVAFYKKSYTHMYIYIYIYVNSYIYRFLLMIHLSWIKKVGLAFHSGKVQVTAHNFNAYIHVNIYIYTRISYIYIQNHEKLHTYTWVAIKQVGLAYHNYNVQVAAHNSNANAASPSD